MKITDDFYNHWPDTIGRIEYLDKAPTITVTNPIVGTGDNIWLTAGYTRINAEELRFVFSEQAALIPPLYPVLVPESTGNWYDTPYVFTPTKDETNDEPN